MKERLLPMVLATFLILVVLLVGVLTDFIGSPIAVDGPEAAVVLTTDMAPVGGTPVMLSLADVAVAPDAIDNFVLYAAILGTSAFGLTYLTIALRSRSSGRQVSFSGWVRSRGTAIV